MKTNGAMTVPKFPQGGFVILFVHKTNYECKIKYGKHLENNEITDSLSTDDNNNDLPSCSKQVSIKVVDAVKKHLVIVELLWPIGMLLLFAILTVVVVYFTNYDDETEIDEEQVEEEEQNEIPLNPSPDIQSEPEVIQEPNCSSPQLSTISCCSPPPLSEHVTLNQLTRKTSENLDKNSKMFLLFVMPVAIYYFLPVIQLVSFYLLTSHKTGNLDLCYYNFRCAYPYRYFNDFNHVWSNICYVFAGVIGFVLVHFHKLKYAKKSSHKFGYGIPPQFGLSNALAFAILIEGLLSASYHVCPNRSNFHHDTCFMYVAVTLSALRLYHSRHPDTALGATKAFALLGIVIITDLLGEVLEYLWYLLLFTILHFVTLVILATQLFFMGRRSIFSLSIFGGIWAVIRNDRSGHSDTNPVASKDVYWLIIVGFLANVGIFVGLGLVPFLDESQPVFDFGTYLLSILGGNLVIYLIYYLVMKLIHRERLGVLTILLLVLSTAFWISGATFFVMTRTSWEESPANSRVKNQDCDTYFYDTHDLWHILSSGALYTTLMLLEFVDVNLWKIPQNKIVVF